MSASPFRDLHTSLREGALSRRQFIERDTALGMAGALALQIAETTAQSASPEASPTAVEPTIGVRPSAGTEGQARGSGGELKIIQWQAPSHLSALAATGDKDSLGASLVSEALLNRDANANLIPNLVTEVPSVANGLLAADFTSVTFNLTEGILWSDGQPLTANDVAFTIDWILDDANGAVYKASYETIDHYEVSGDHSITIFFKQPNPVWADGYTGAGGGVVYPRHILESGGTEAADAFKSNPIGTGPYKVETFSVNDQVIYVVNEHYREPNKPFFERVVIKGGGDAISAARAVIQTGDYDYAWNIAIEPEVAKSLEDENSKGALHVLPGLGVERININFSDPDKEVDGQRSEKNTPHPFLTDHAVRQAINIGIDRETIANTFFFGGDAEPAVVNIISGIPAMESPNTAVIFDPEAAKTLLDEAGWTLDGDVRQKDGVKLELDFATTISSVRQKIQAVVKANLEDIGFKVSLIQIDAGVFFDSAAGNDQNNTHFYQDLNLFQSGVGSPPPVAYMIRWYAGPDGENIAQKSNGWGARNFQRYNNPEYDAIYEQATTESNPERQNELFIQLNDILYNDAAVLPLVRSGDRNAASRTLNFDNIAPSPYEFDYWNIANWNRIA